MTRDANAASNETLAELFVGTRVCASMTRTCVASLSRQNTAPSVGCLVPGAYAADASLWKSGVENGGQLTPEAALVRLWLELTLTVKASYVALGRHDEIRSAFLQVVER